MEIYKSKALSIHRTNNNTYLIQTRAYQLSDELHNATSVQIDHDEFLKLSWTLVNEAGWIRSNRMREKVVNKILEPVAPPTEVVEPEHECISCNTKENVQLWSLQHGEYVHACRDCWPSLRANMRIR